MYKKNELILTFFLLFNIISCKKEIGMDKDLIGIFSLSQEIQNFCLLTIPCVEKEVDSTFKNQIQQKVYLKNKISQDNCLGNQSYKILQKLQIRNEQKKEILESLKKLKMGNEFQISFFSQFLNEEQNKILKFYQTCTQKIKNSKDCNEIKTVIKEDNNCKNIFN